MAFKTILVAGASRGIGLAVADHFADQCDRLLAVSRTKASVGEWIQADLSTLAGVETVAGAVGNEPLDALLYMGGTWETDAFTRQYIFEECSDEDINRVILHINRQFGHYRESRFGRATDGCRLSH